MTIRHCRKCNDWHDLSEPWPVQCLPDPPKRSGLAGPACISDTMEAGVKSMLDGKIYTSKSLLRQTYKQAGVTEVGNDPSVINPKPFKRPRPDRMAIKAAVRRAASRVGLGA